MIAATGEPGAILAERLGIEIIRNEGRDVVAACIACTSSDGFRVHRQSGIAHCHVCKVGYSHLELAETILGDKRAAWALLEELNLEQPRTNGNGYVAPSDPLEAIARAKHIPLESLKAFGAKAAGANCISIPAYGPDGAQCTTLKLWTTGTDKQRKGLLEKNSKSGVYLPHNADGSVRLPKPGDTWHIVEGPKDAAALHSLKLGACGVNGSSMAPRFRRLFRGVHVVLVPDRDTAGINGADKSASILFGVAASVRIAALPSPVVDKSGADVRDILGQQNGRELVMEAIADAREWELPNDNGCNLPKRSSQNDNFDFDLPSIRTPSGRTEVANARRFVAMNGDRVRWCASWGKWLYWDGKRWRIDDTCAVESMAKGVFELVWQQVAELRDDADAIRFAKATGSARGIASFLTLARSEPGIAISPDKLDADPDLLNCANGTLNTRTGEFEPHNRDDLLTRLCPTPYLPNASRKTWLRFLGEIMRNDAELIGYLRRGGGCSIIGEILEHALFFCFGDGANGKTTYLQAITDTLGDDYAMAAPPDLLMAKSGDQHPTALADLHGKRFISCIEAGEGRRMAEALVKTLTGGDKIRARRMREDFWEFRPSHSIWLAANHKPIIRGRDSGIWRRIKMIPFTVSIPPEKQDPNLPHALREEAPGILAWLVEGCLEWRQVGMQAPEQVKRATADYRDEMDVLGEFLAECCLLGNPVETASSELFGAYGRWCARSGERQMSRTAFGNGLAERGLEKVKQGTVRWRGIELQSGA